MAVPPLGPLVDLEVEEQLDFEKFVQQVESMGIESTDLEPPSPLTPLSPLSEEGVCINFEVLEACIRRITNVRNLIQKLIQTKWS
jgi:hypothetical protein